jgi:hypothetical protein
MTPMSPEEYERLIAPRTLAAAGGSYVTDGRRLFRVVSPLAAPPDLEVAELEDCMTLETDSYSPGELWAMRLVLVRREAAAVVAEPVALPVSA